MNPHTLRWCLFLLIALSGCSDSRQNPGPSEGEDPSASTSKGESLEQTTSGSQDLPSKDASTGGDSTTDGSSTQNETPPTLQDLELRMLTASQYQNAVESVFRLSDLDGGWVRRNATLTSFVDPGGFSNESKHQVTTKPLLDAYLVAGQKVASTVARLWPPNKYVSDCAPAEPYGEACVRAMIKKTGSQLFRRPMTESEVEEYFAIFSGVSAETDVPTAYKTLIQALINAPKFIYLAESPESSLKPWHVAARLSLFLWDRLPDAELQALAADGTILQPEVLKVQAKRLLADPNAKPVVQRFVQEWLELQELEHMFKGFESEIKTKELVAEFNGYVDSVFFGDDPTLKQLWTAPVTFEREGFRKIYQDHHAGVLGHPAFSWAHSHVGSTDPIRRGVVVREQVLCTHLPDPPPDVEMLLKAPNAQQTTRERFAEHSSNDGCAACHSLIDPIGFGFESFDFWGRFREMESEKPVDDLGELHGTDVNGTFRGANQLGQKLANSQDATRCLVEKWTSYALARELDAKDRAWAEKFQVAFASSDQNLQELLLAIATSEVITHD